jgi:hypothetical protein
VFAGTSRGPFSPLLEMTVRLVKSVTSKNKPNKEIFPTTLSLFFVGQEVMVIASGRKFFKNQGF